MLQVRQQLGNLRNFEDTNSVPGTLCSHWTILFSLEIHSLLILVDVRNNSIKNFCLTIEFPAGCINVNSLTFQFHQAPDSIFSIFLQCGLMNHLYLYFQPCYLGQPMPLIFSLSFTEDEEKWPFYFGTQFHLQVAHYHCCKMLAYKCHHFTLFC